jgi:hypothetical protein
VSGLQGREIDGSDLPGGGEASIESWAEGESAFDFGAFRIGSTRRVRPGTSDPKRERYLCKLYKRNKMLAPSLVELERVRISRVLRNWKTHFQFPNIPIVIERSQKRRKIKADGDGGDDANREGNHPKTIEIS